MKPRARLELTLALIGLCVARPAAGRTPDDETPIVCGACEAWNRPHAPVRLHGNTSYVGVAGLTSVLVRTTAGLVLLDGGLPQSASLIAANIVALGHSPHEVKYLLTSHAHYDHVGGVAALRRRTGARVVGSAPTVAALAAGHPLKDDPQFRSGSQPDALFPKVTQAATVRDGETLTLGDITFTAHLTAGHTPGATSWTWRSCEATRCVDVVYGDSLNTVSDDGYRYTDHPTIIEQLTRSIELVEHLPCEVLITVHPGFMALDDKLAARGAHTNPFIDPTACRSYAAQARQALAARLAAEHAHP